MMKINKTEFLDYLDKMIARNLGIVKNQYTSFMKAPLSRNSSIKMIADILDQTNLFIDMYNTAKAAGDDDFIYSVNPNDNSIHRHVKPIDEIMNKVKIESPESMIHNEMMKLSMDVKEVPKGEKRDSYVG